MNLDTRLSEVESLIRVCLTRKARKAVHIATEEPALLRAGAVMLCSHVEGYFEELAEEVVICIDDRAQFSSEFPEAIRAIQVVKSSGTWDVTDGHLRWQLVRTCAQNPLIDDNIPHVPGLLDTGLHTGGFANPGTNDIKRLFQSLGIVDVWNSFSVVEPRSLYKNEIDAIVSRRNQIAHGNFNSRVPAPDLQSYIANFRRTADVFDEIAMRHLVGIFPHFTW